MKKKSKAKSSTSLADKLRRLPYHLGLFILAFPLSIVILKYFVLAIFLLVITFALHKLKQNTKHLQHVYNLMLYVWLWIIIYFGFILSVLLTGLFASAFVSVLKPYLY